MKPILDIEFLKYESIDFGLDLPGHAPNLVYHFTRQTRGPAMHIRTSDRMGFHLGIVRRGQALFSRGGAPHALGYGSIFLVRQDDSYELKKSDPHPLELTLIMFDPAVRELWRQTVGWNTETIEPGSPDRLIALTDLSFEQLSRIAAKRIERANAFAPFFLQTLAAEAALHALEEAPEKQLYLKCREYLQTHGLGLRTAEQIGPACGVSRSKLFALFRTHGDDPPRACLDRLKIHAAQDRLQATDWTCARIAEELGYADGPTFAKAFARVTGMPPGRWRRKHRHQ